MSENVEETEIRCPECGSNIWWSITAERAEYIGLEPPAVRCMGCSHEYETKASA